MHHLIGRFYNSVVEKNPAPVSHQSGLLVMKQLHDIFADVDEFRLAHSSAEPAKMMSNLGGKKNKHDDVLITGASGFIGSALVERLVESGGGIRAAVRRESDGRELANRYPGKINACCGDITDPSFTEELFSGIKTVYHLAAATSGEWVQHMESTVRGTQNIMNAILSSGCQRFIYISTLSLLNQSKYPSDKIIDENFPYEEYPERRDPYCFSKLWAEEIVRSQSDKIADLIVTILRPGIVYGPGRLPFGLATVRKGNRLIIKGSSKRLLPLVFIENLIDAIILAGKAEKSGLYNVIDKEDITAGQLISTYKQFAHASFKTLYLPIPVLLAIHGTGAAARKVFCKHDNYILYHLKCLQKSVRHSSNKIETELGWRQKVGFADGMKFAVHH